jgi:Cu(I)/Ag(I) efflux system membrane fusion protein
MEVMLKRLLMVSGLVGLAAATAIGARAAAGSESMKTIVAAYLEIQSQLAADKTDTIKTRAQAIAAQATAMGDAGGAIAAAAGSLAKAPDIKAARDVFGSLSDAVIDAAKKDGWTDVSGLKLAYCPMVNRSWLQAEDKAQNPYAGKAMSGCGEFRKMQ